MPPAQVERAMTTSPDSVGPALAALKEDQWFERKSARIQARDLADWLVGFANADGGTIVVGCRAARSRRRTDGPIDAMIRCRRASTSVILRFESDTGSSTA